MIDWKEIAKVEYHSAMDIIRLQDFNLAVLRKRIMERNKAQEENKRLRDVLLIMLSRLEEDPILNKAEELLKGKTC